MQANQANVTFDTHEAVKALKSSGFDEKQAESVVETINKAVNETVATKSDLAVLATKDDIKDMATKDDIKDMATKDELGALADKMATKDDIKDMATKADLEVQGAKIDALRETVEGIQENIKENLATKAELKVLTKTVEGIQENIEKNMATKTDLSKLETRMMRMMWLQLMAMLGMFVTMVVALT